MPRHAGILSPETLGFDPKKVCLEDEKSVELRIYVGGQLARDIVRANKTYKMSQSGFIRYILNIGLQHLPKTAADRAIDEAEADIDANILAEV